MVSRIARQDVASLEQQGVHLSIDEMVRLNALGLAVESGDAIHEAFLLPRAVVIGELVLREPTLGQQVWLDTFTSLVRCEDNVTGLCASALAYSTPHDKLPDTLDLSACIKAVKGILPKIEHIGVNQLAAALLYVVKGCNHRSGEYPPLRKGEEIDIPDNADVSIDLGMIINGGVCTLGLSLAEAERLTRAELDAMRLQKFEENAVARGTSREDWNKILKRQRHKEYLRYLEELKKKDRENGG